MNEEDNNYRERARKIDALHRQYDRIVAGINRRRDIEEIEKLELISEASQALQEVVDGLG